MSCDQNLFISQRRPKCLGHCTNGLHSLEKVNVIDVERNSAGRDGLFDLNREAVRARDRRDQLLAVPTKMKAGQIVPGRQLDFLRLLDH